MFHIELYIDFSEKVLILRPFPNRFPLVDSPQHSILPDRDGLLHSFTKGKHQMRVWNWPIVGKYIARFYAILTVLNSYSYHALSFLFFHIAGTQSWELGCERGKTKKVKEEDISFSLGCIIFLRVFFFFFVEDDGPRRRQNQFPRICVCLHILAGVRAVVCLCAYVCTRTYVYTRVGWSSGKPIGGNAGSNGLRGMTYGRRTPPADHRDEVRGGVERARAALP